MLNVWRKRPQEHASRDWGIGFVAVAGIALAAVAVAALVTGLVIDAGSNWTAIADVGGLLFAIAVLIAVIGSLRALRQRTEAHQRAEWWKRAEKASDYLLSRSPSSVDLGVALLDALVEDGRPIGQREWTHIFAVTTAVTLGENAEADQGHSEGVQMTEKKGLDRHMQNRVRAARVSVKATGKLGISPEPCIIELAETETPSDGRSKADNYLKPAS